MIDKFGTVRLSAFDTTIKWFVGDFINFVIKYKLQEWDLDSSSSGLTLVDDAGYIVVYSNGVDVNNTIPHEVIHAISRMANHRGLLFDITNHELIAHLVGYVSGKILDKINS